jgi:hypothetical protein
VYNLNVDKTRHLPDGDRLSILAGTILLAYALARFVNLPIRVIEINLPGFFLELQLNARTATALIVAGLVATGADWLLRGHPKVQSHSTAEHWLLPALTAWVISIPLYQLPLGLLWWTGFAVAGVLLTLVLIAEYITIDDEDIRYPLAAAGLTALSYALFLILAISLRASGTRLVLSIPALTATIALVTLRALHLRTHGRWALKEGLLVSLVCAQIAAGLHYLPLSPISYGMLILAPPYALTSFLANLSEGEGLRRAMIEPAVILFFVMIAGLWIR